MRSHSAQQIPLSFGWDTVSFTWRHKKRLKHKIWVSIRIKWSFCWFLEMYSSLVYRNLKKNLKTLPCLYFITSIFVFFNLFSLQASLAPASLFSPPCRSPIVTKLPVLILVAMTNPIGSPQLLPYPWCRYLARILCPISAVVWCVRPFHLWWLFTARIIHSLHAHLDGGVCGWDTLSSW